MIQLSNLHKLYNKNKPNQVNAVDGVDLSIKSGDFVGIVGANGSGKTTLLNLVAGSVLPTSGAINIDGDDVTKLADYERSKWIARVFQNPLSGTAPDLSILDNFRLAALRTQPKQPVIGINTAFKKQVQDRIAVLGMGLENKVEQAMGTLSGGQRQALTLLMSVMDHTDILLLDEPTAALDPRSANTILQTANAIVKEYKLTAVLITHNLKDAHQYGNRLIQMAEGKVLRDLDANAKTALALPEMFGWFS